MGGMQCPSCESPDVRRSRRRWFERPISVFGLFPFRCSACRARFFHFFAGTGE
jgi:hypothetical protein